MDSLHSILFYALATVAVAGTLLTALGPARLRSAAMVAVAAGLGGLYADLSAAFAGLCAALAYLAVAALLISLAEVPEPPRRLAQQVAGPLAGAAFLVLAYLAWRGGLHPGYRAPGEVNAGALGRLLVNRDALALEALAAALLLAVVALRHSLRPGRP